MNNDECLHCGKPGCKHCYLCKQPYCERFLDQEEEKAWCEGCLEA